MIKSMLEARNLPALMSREAMLDLLQREEYGYLPPPPDSLAWDEGEPQSVRGGTATLTKIVLHGTVCGRPFSFPAYRAMPNEGSSLPFFVFINFREDIPDKYYPLDAIMAQGYAVLSLYYNDVTMDDGDFLSGVAGALYPNGQRGEYDAGKIAVWAWAIHRVMDYAQTHPRLDLHHGCVCGHSRLGKTALFAAATDSRFAMAYSNDSGCSGAAVTRGKAGERIADITSRFPYWFCPHYAQYAGRENETPFEQHMLIACIAPRPVLVGSASEDEWADPVSEFLACAAASPAWEAYGLPGFITPDALPETGDCRFDGSIGYHLREGAHFFAEEDWQRLMRFFAQKRSKG